MSSTQVSVAPGVHDQLRGRTDRMHKQEVPAPTVSTLSIGLSLYNNNNNNGRNGSCLTWLATS